MAEVLIESGGLREALETAVGGPLTLEALAKLEELDWSEYRAEGGEPWAPLDDLRGLELCSNLRRLSLDGNHVRSLAPLAGLAHLEEIWMCQNALGDLAPLANAKRLRKLIIDMNTGVRDLGPLRGLPALSYVNCASTKVSDVTPLLDCPALTKVSIYGLPLDLSPGSPNRLAIVELLKRGVEVTLPDIEPLRAEARPAAGSAESGLADALRALGAFRVVRLLEDASLGGRDEDGNWPLHAAVKPNLTESFGKDPISDRLEVARVLLAAGAELEAKNRAGLTPLNHLLQHNAKASIELVRQLLDAGADPRATSPSDVSPLASAIEHGRADLVELLIERGADASSPRMFNAFCQNGWIDRVRAALDAGHDPNAPERWIDRPALHAAAFGGHVDVVELLSARGAAVDALDAAGGTALHRATKAEVVRALLARGAKVDVPDSTGETALFKALEFGSPDTVRLLVDVGASVTVRSARGRTPLHLCAARTDDAVATSRLVGLLLSCGADPDARDLDDKSPVDVARFPKVKRVLDEARGRGESTDGDDD